MSSSRVEIPFPTGLGRARLELRGGVPFTRVRAVAPSGGYRDADPLATVVFDGRPAEVRADGGLVAVDFRRTWLEALRGEGSNAEIELSARLPWSLEARGGIDGIELDLSALSILEIEVRGGVRRAEIRMPRPVGTTRVSFRGGVCDLAILRPEGVPAAFHLHGGGTGITVDDLSLGAVGHLDWKSPGFDASENRLVVEVHGGAASALLRTTSEGSARAPFATSDLVLL